MLQVHDFFQVKRESFVNKRRNTQLSLCVRLPYVSSSPSTYNILHFLFSIRSQPRKSQQGLYILIFFLFFWPILCGWPGQCAEPPSSQPDTTPNTDTVLLCFRAADWINNNTVLYASLCSAMSVMFCTITFFLFPCVFPIFSFTIQSFFFYHMFVLLWKPAE